jgi:2,3-bisphosphoglycerate-independent phosphoglycerate mutase
MSKKIALIILDGWGKGDATEADAIYNANTPFIDSCYKKYPNSELITSGEDVGLPEGQMGNSEVGHLNIGAGRVVYQDLVRINKAIKENAFQQNKILKQAFQTAKENNCGIHFLGLVSSGGIHSHDTHLYELCNMAKTYQLKNVFIHAITDGRDCDPKSGIGHITNLQNHIQNSVGEIASMIGRYYAMDRDNRWDRIKIAYDMLLFGKANTTNNFIEAIQNCYANNETDEFIKPLIKTDEQGNPIGRIKPNDVVICFNFRTDRCREITTVLTQKNMPEFNMQTLPLHYYTMTNYDNTFKNIEVIFSKDNLNNTLGEILAKAGKKQLRIAETEKYPHVTFFFSGGREEPFTGENRIMINSPKVATYDLQPDMSAEDVTLSILNELEKKENDFICLNLANADMVGHTGVYQAIVKAVEKVDSCTKRIVEKGIENNYSFIIIADHGNADCAINSNGTPNTAHTTNPVPCILIDKDFKTIKNGRLADLAPTILTIMNIPIPTEMTGNILI